MSRNLGRDNCRFCYGEVTLVQKPRPITREEAGVYYDVGRDGFGYAGGIFANAECIVCRAKYIAWVDLSVCAGYGRYEQMRADPGALHGRPFFDLSYRRAFDDEPDEADLPDWEIEEFVLTAEQCARLEAFSGTIRKRTPWPRCARTGRKVYGPYGCPCEEHR